MKKEENRAFIKKTETLVKPIDVTAISFLGDFNKIFPKKTQYNIMKRGSKKIPYMGFIVDPYCFFLSYEIKNVKAAEALLPKEYKLLETSIFSSENKKPVMVIGVFNARTSAFIGTRMEIYLIARNKETGKAAWIIVDYETDTNSYDPASGFSGYTSDTTIFTTTPYGELLVDIENSKTNKRISFNADLNMGKMKDLDQTLWVEGNWAVDYGGELQYETSSIFSLIFDPVLMKQALHIPLKFLEIETNSYFNNLIDCAHPLTAACFPYSQHYIIEQNSSPDEIKDEQDLENKIAKFVGTKNFKTMQGADIKKPLLAGIVVSAILTYGLIIFLLIRLLS